MTTIIVVVVVALVFFVGICVATFMVWKREEEMRTDSIRSIEANLQELGYRMTEDFGRSARRSISYTPTIEPLPAREHQGRHGDPFYWTRDVEPVVEETQAFVDHVADQVDAPVAQPPVTEVAPAVEPAPVETEDLPQGIEAFFPKGPATEAPSPQLPPELEAADDALEYPEHEAQGELNEFAYDAPEEELPEETDDSYLDISSLEQLMNDDIHIDLDGIDVPELMGGYIADYSAEEIPQPRAPIGRDIGRSGRRYTAEELDMLIKE
ncbi:MAG: hypothetical protein KBS66_05660 [Eubacterium sp.]|nr:hypothetical protein [Candidatus Colimonas fimequi]